MTPEQSMTTRDRHDEPESPTTATQFSPPCAISFMNGVNGNHPGILEQDGDSVRLNRNGVNGNHPGTLQKDEDSVRLNVAPNANQVNEQHPGARAQDGDSGRLNAAPNGAIATHTNRCLGNASRPEHIRTIDDMESIFKHC
jgi:hypothetical protein